MSANSEKVQNGQPRAKQERNAPGVCNEHGLTPKGKMCSELGRNAETVAETTTGHSVTLQDGLTVCNTEFLKAYVDPNRFFKATDWMPTLNQDGKVLRIHVRMNYVCTNRMLQGVIQGWS